MSREIEPQPGSNFLGRHRKILRTGAASLAAASGVFFSACETNSSYEATPVPSATMPAELPTPFGVGPDFVSTSVLAYNGIDIHLNADALPVRWTDWSGNPHEFDLGAMRALREKAIASGEPEIIDLIPIENEVKTSSTSTQFEKAHPILKELPDDVLTDEELAERGVEIVQADRTKLYIRKGAFEEGKPLAGIREKDPNRMLTIVLFDGEFVSPFYMQDERYLPYAYSMPRSSVDAVHVRSAKIEETKKSLEAHRIDPGLVGQRKLESILTEKSKLFHYMHIASNYELSEQAAYEFEGERDKDGKVARGLYTTSVFTGDATIYLPVGTDSGQSGKFLRVYFDGNGQVVVDEYAKVGISKLPYFQRKDLFPDPELFMRDVLANCENGKYPFGAQSIGHTLRHEEFHEKGIGQEGLEKDCEADVDNAAMDGIEVAWETWESSGYKDNSGYRFVFSTPDGDGYALTVTKYYFKPKTGF